MPQSIHSFDRINIPAPCDADWDSMIGNDQVRFCEHCNLRVTDLSAMTRQKAMDFVARAEGRVCVRFIQKPNGGVLTRKMPEKLYRIQRRVSRLAASAFTATLSLSTAVAQSCPASGSDQPRQVVELVHTESEPEFITDEFTASLAGIIRKEAEEGPPISDATVVLVDRETGEERTVTTSPLGEYSFQFLPQGVYLVWARKSGYGTDTQTVTVPANEAVNLDIELYERTIGFGMGGAMAVIIEPEDPLFKAVTDNDIEKVRTLAASDRNLNFANRRDGKSLLIQAAALGNLKIVETLVAFGADVNLRNGSGDTPLTSITSTVTPELVKHLIAAGARVNARDNNGASPLMIAARTGSVSVVKELIEAGANVNARDSSGETCLFSAARSNAPEAVILLLDSGVDANVLNEDGDNALMAAAGAGSYDSFRSLYQRGLPENLVNEDGETLLMLAAGNEDARIAKMLIESGAEVNRKRKYGMTALMLAAGAGSLDAVTSLIAARAELDEKDDDGETALMKAVRAGSLECVQALLKAGAGFTARNEEGQRALTLAREYANAEIVKLLESRGAPE